MKNFKTLMTILILFLFIMGTLSCGTGIRETTEENPVTILTLGGGAGGLSSGPTEPEVESDETTCCPSQYDTTWCGTSSCNCTPKEDELSDWDISCEFAEEEATE